MIKRGWKVLLSAVMALTIALPALASIDVYDFKNNEQEKQFQELTSTLRCPKCQNNDIADSNATLAQDMRRKVYEMLQQGKSEKEIIDYMIARYGNFVTYDPPVMVSTIILWAGPLLFVIIGFTVLVIRSRKNSKLATENSDTLDAEEEARLKAILSDMDQPSDTDKNNNTKVNK
ncbi:cytochrome c-type biogenesis protein [Photobacterium damselae]|uniref:cytochrome c-type biogenesis protein n=1 Tax=Photobacterium damselae TaxID=38293 RepID=UPI0040678A2C